MSRLAMALIAYLVLGALAFATLSDQRIRSATLFILALFAFKSWVRRRDVLHPDGESGQRPDAAVEDGSRPM
jgi:uncharacterized membrane protein YfcA